MTFAKRCRESGQFRNSVVRNSPGDSDVEELKHGMAAPSMPEQLFGSSFLRLIHRHSGCVLDFNAADALRQWHQANENPVQVPCGQIAVRQVPYSATCWHQSDLMCCN